MESNTPGTSRLNLSNIIAACIIAAGLVSAARIVSKQPTTTSGAVATQSVPATGPSTVLTTTSARPLVAPPFSQDTVQGQVRNQLLVAPELQTYKLNKVVYRLSDVTVSDVSYSAKDDAFGFLVHWNWVPAMPSDGLKQTYATLSNNGYDQYSGTVVMVPGYRGTSQNASVCVK